MNEQSRQKCSSEEVTFQSSVVTKAIIQAVSILERLGQEIASSLRPAWFYIVRTCFREVLEREGRMVGSVGRQWQITEDTLDLTKEYVVISQGFYCCERKPWPKATQGGQDLFQFIVPQQSPSLREPGGQELRQRTQRNVAYWPAFLACYYPPGPLAVEGAG